MESRKQHRNGSYRTNHRAATLALAIMFVLAVVAAQSAEAQTYKVIYNFTDGADGADPVAGLTMDSTGNLYGTTAGTYYPYTAGTVFKLAKKGSGWIFSPLYDFGGGSDGGYPVARVVFGPDGTLYGTTAAGGVGGCDYGGEIGCGTVFNLRPPPTFCKNVLCPWTETVLYRFSGGSDGRIPLGDLVFDQMGNLYGTTTIGGSANSGTVFKLTPSGGGWTESVLYSFTGGSDGANPTAGLIFDNAGNSYSTTQYGGLYGQGTVFELLHSGSFNTLYNFQNGSDGEYPRVGLIFNSLGNLYGATTMGGSGGGGTAFTLTRSGSSWAFTTLYGFSGGPYSNGPFASLIMDSTGNLFGTTYSDGIYNAGSVFKLTPAKNGDWTYTSLHDFADVLDGGFPSSNVVFDTHGTLYGTASFGGTGTTCSPACGVVWEITP